MMNEDLRAVIETALKRRDPEATVRSYPSTADGGGFCVCVWFMHTELIFAGTNETEALQRAALVFNIRPDGSDPEEEVERFRAAFRREEDRADARAQDFDDLAVRVWRAATGDTHEGPASIEALLDAVTALKSERDAARADLAHLAEQQQRLMTTLGTMAGVE